MSLSQMMEDFFRGPGEESTSSGASVPLMIAIRDGPMLEDTVREAPLASTLLWLFAFLCRHPSEH